MSSLIVEVLPIESIKKHPNADSLSISTIKGWQVIYNHDSVTHEVGELVIYVPPEAMVPLELAEKWGVDKYLTWYKKGEYVGYGKTRQINLRGEMSYGFMAQNEGFEEGQDVSEHYNLKKWEHPKETIHSGSHDREVTLFYRYTDIENWRNYSKIIQEGEEVIVTEKIHGTNSRIGLCIEDGESPILMVGTRKNRIKMGDNSLYETPVQKYPQIEDALNYIWKEYQATESVIVYGEIYGNIQDLKYGIPGQHDFRCFDISVDRKYIDSNEFKSLCNEFNIPIVPILYEGPFDIDKIKSLACGLTTLMDNPSKTDYREGVVIKPCIERYDLKLHRVILKLISDEYLLRKNPKE